MSLADCVLSCFDNKELVKEFTRLTGVRLSPAPRSGLDILVDRATGNDPSVPDEAWHAFIAFVWDVVWIRLPEEAFAEEGAVP